MLIDGVEYEIVYSGFIKENECPTLYKGGARVSLILKNSDRKYMTFITHCGSFCNFIPLS